MTREESEIAKRWSILNAWGWPSDVPKPSSYCDRYTVAVAEMAKAVREIGLRRCLDYWNSEEFKSTLPTLRKEYGP